ncbi:hypothetical protein ACA910_021105 [Epithemia clementina (nom. ined.)]
MSGLLPDLASWALRGQQRGDNNNNNNAAENNHQRQDGDVEHEALTPEELRAQRVQRMELLRQQRLSSSQGDQQMQHQHQGEEGTAQETVNAADTAAAATSKGPEPMDVDPPSTTSTSTSITSPANPDSPSTTQASSTTLNNDTSSSSTKKKRKGDKESDASRKFQRKKELLLRKVLGIVLSSSPRTNVLDLSLVTMDIGSTDITVQAIAEVLSNRVALSPDAIPSEHSGRPKKSLLAYLSDSHRKAAEELKTLRTSSASNGGGKQSHAQQQLQQQNNELIEILQEIQKQVVSYSATVLIEPDLFELGTDSVAQLSDCLLGTLTDLSSSITFGVGGNIASSFYFCLVDELLAQDASSLERVVTEIVDAYENALLKCESVLDNSAVPILGGGAVGVSDNSPMTIVSALSSLCMHKKVAEIISERSDFLLPPAQSPRATEMVRPRANNNPLSSPPTGVGGGGGGANRLLQQFMANLAQQQQPAFKKRSGPGLEKFTFLGMCFRLGIPTKNNPTFSPTSILRQSFSALESATSQQRQQLRLYQESCNQLLHNMIKAGTKPRQAVMDWFVDGLLVNAGASATRPDITKVSSPNLLLNMSVALLKLCEPFVSDPKKHHLIDPHFCSEPSAHKGVYASTGDDAVPRLASSEDIANAMKVEYNPKNAFVTQLFFLTARAVHFGIASSLSQHESLLRHLSHLHWQITSRGSSSDLQSDPQFAVYVSRQRAAEVALFQEDMVADHLRFLQLVAKVLCEMKDEDLAIMPEDFVSDVCHVITSMAKLKPKLLRGIDVTFTFKQAVKLLSPTYASMVRNYNLRAMLGDVLYELFLPPSNDVDRRESVPTSVYIDSRTNETYLLSDPGAQECLAPSLLLLYGEVEHTGYYDRMSHRAKISSIIKYLWESSEHRPAFRRITQNKESFIKFANGIMNETNTLIATVMQKLPEIREAQVKIKSPQEWAALSEEQQKQISERLEENEREVKHALPLCNKTLQMFGYLNTDEDIRNLFLLEELCARLVSMLLHVLTKLVGSKGLELKVDNPEELDFKPKVMLRDLCYIFSLFATAPVFQEECAKSGGDPGLLRQALKTVRRLNLLQGDHLDAFAALPDLMEGAAQRVAEDEKLLADAPDEFLDEILSTYMKDPVVLPSGHYVDRSTITQHLLNDPIDPFNRNPMTIDDVKPATELKERMNAWLEEKKKAALTSPN